jgi:signal transduction histidine kinase/ActR/RegA family two-component response regulator
MRRPASLRSSLLLLAAGSILPLLALSLVLGSLLVRREEDTVRRAAMDRNHTFSTAIDALMRGHIAALRALGSSAWLTRGEVREFGAQAIRVLATQPEWRNIILLSPSGQQLTNTRFAYGTRLPADTNPESLATAVAAGGVVIGNLERGPVSGLWGIPVRLPIVQGGHVRYVLELIVEPGSLSRLMREQGYPGGWTIGLVDRNGQIIARLPERPLGERLPDPTWTQLQRGDEGTFLARTIEGRSSYSAYTRSPLTGWTVGTSIPVAQVGAPLRHAALLFALGALLSLAVAVLFAWRVGRRIAEPIGRIAAAARTLGAGTAPELAAIGRSTRVQEVVDVARALDDAAASIAEREALRQREQEALRAADRAKDEFLAMLGHELRNPLNAITASAHVLRLSKPGADTAARAHAVIDRQARQMTRLVEDLLDVSRLAMRTVTLQREHLDLAALVSQVVATWCAARAVRARRPLPLELAPALVDADRARIEQVIANLLDNAEKFSGPDAPIEIRLRADAGWAVLEVRDEGRGIPADELPHVFELFVQGAQSFERPHGGIGLGLTLVKRLVELHGGSVTADSGGPGLGAAFTIRLPLVAGSAQPSTVRESAQGSPAQRVLIVEDNDDGRAVLEALLALEGHVVRSERSGLAAVHAAEEFAPDIALVDIGLPDIDGYEVARRIRALRQVPAPRLIAVSGYGQPRDQELAYEAGFDLHLVKPVAPDFLHNVFGAMTSRSRAAP